LNLKQLLKNIFADAEEKNQQVKPFVQEILARSDSEIAAYNEWLYSEKQPQAIAIFKSRLRYKNELSDGEQIQIEFIEGKATSGFVCYFNQQFFQPVEFQHLFDYLKQQVLTLDYKLYVSDTQTRLQQDNTHTKERHYLKPKYVYNEAQQKTVQQYGNIIIELHKFNNEPEKIHFIVNRYSGYDYSEAISADELYEKLFA
jgi:hypothetical protein